MREELIFEAEPFADYIESDELEEGATAGGVSYEWAEEADRGNREYVRWVQQSLNKILNLNLAVDGVAGPQTRSAIRSFQRRAELLVDGIVGPQTEAALVEAGAPPPPRSAAALPGGLATIAWVQGALNRALKLRLAVDGVAGPQTRSALRSFQQKQGLAATGEPDAQTLRLLGKALPTGTPQCTASPCDTLLKPCEVLNKFAFDSDAVTQEHEPKLTQIACCILASQKTANPIKLVSLVGHTDDVGTDEFNLDLGRRRAESVKSSLQAKLDAIMPGSSAGVTILTDTRGESQPASKDPAQNRRVQVCLPLLPVVQPPPITAGFRIVAKSFIMPIGTNIGATGCVVVDPDSNVRLLALSTITDASYSENPLTDIKDRIYRLYSARTFYVTCENGRITAYSYGKLDTDVGKECPPAADIIMPPSMPPGAECLNPPPLVSVGSSVGPSGVSSIDFVWTVKGRPHPAAEPLFQSVCPRLSFFIWHEVSGRIECTPSGPTLTKLRLTGSRFPSHRVWVNGVVSGFIPQGTFSNLWLGSPADPTLVK